MAGRFYPADPDELRATVRHFLDAASRMTGREGHADDLHRRFPKAIIAPHAGYPYSGPIAASAYVHLRPGAAVIRRVVLLGPAHRHPVGGLALPECAEFATPLGRVRVDEAARALLVEGGLAEILDEAHMLEHALEVQLPFLQEVLGDGFAIVPLVVGEASPDDVRRACQALWGGRETLFVISSDLSHFHTYADAQRLDRMASDAIEALDADALAVEQACGCIPIQGLLMECRSRGMSGKTVDLRNSGDTSGRREEVVGYGAYVIVDEGESLLEEHRSQLLATARASIQSGVEKGCRLEVAVLDYPEELRSVKASFVTLRIADALRGCMGSSHAIRPLVEDVAYNAYAAAFLDPRFSPLDAEELPSLQLHISILSPLERLECGSHEDLMAAIRPGVDGLLLREGKSRGTLLPAVWETLPEPTVFVRELKLKAGFEADYWSDELEVFRYTTESFS